MSKPEAAGFRNSKECGGCQRKTPKSELFSCITCQATLDDAEEAVICGLCFAKAHKQHEIVDYCQATQKDLETARQRIQGDRQLSEARVEALRKHFAVMMADIMKALEADYEGVGSGSWGICPPRRDRRPSIQGRKYQRSLAHPTIYSLYLSN